jgi:hypothetical protein
MLPTSDASFLTSLAIKVIYYYIMDSIDLLRCFFFCDDHHSA